MEPGRANSGEESSARGFKQSRDLLNKDLGLRHPGADLCFLELHKIHVVTLLAAFKKVVEDSRGVPADPARSHKMLVEETSHTRVS